MKSYAEKLLAAVEAVPGLGDYVPERSIIKNRDTIEGPAHNDKLVAGRKLKFRCMSISRVPEPLLPPFFAALRKEFKAKKVGFTDGGDLYLHIPAHAATNAK